MENYYTVLDIRKTATTEEIRKAYYQKALQCHPDKLLQSGTPATQSFSKLEEAWTILGNEEQRKVYDSKLKESQLRGDKAIHEKLRQCDLIWNQESELYEHQCRCGGYFTIEKDGLQEDIVIVGCDSCSLTIEIGNVE